MGTGGRALPGPVPRLLLHRPGSRSGPTCSTGCPVTFSLAVGAAVIWLVAGVAIGVLSALRRGTFFDRAAMTVALAGVSLPIFFTGLMALAFFSYKLAGSSRPAAPTRRSPRTRRSGRTT